LLADARPRALPIHTGVLTPAAVLNEGPISVPAHSLLLLQAYAESASPG